MQGKTVAESAVVMRHTPMPNETNIAGSMHGGDLLKHIDNAGGMAAWRHARNPVVTVSLEQMSFLAPINLGQLLSLKASVHRVGHTSIDVGVRVETEDLNTGAVRHVASCYLTYVAVDAAGHPVAVPPLIISNAEEERRLMRAQERHYYRQSLQKAAEEN